MPDTIRTLARLALAAAATAVAVGATACGASPTAPANAPHASALSSAAHQPGAKATAGRRGGYNVVAD